MSSSESAEPYREFITEMTLRIERATRRLELAVEAIDRKTDRHSAAIRTEIREQRAEMRAYFERWDAKFEQQREESRRYFEDIQAENRAQRAALFRMLDRLDGGGTAPAG